MKGKVIQFNFNRHVDEIMELDDVVFADLIGIIDPYPRSWWRTVKGYVFKMDDGSIAGYAVYKMKKSTRCKDKPYVFYIELVGVDPGYQGQGIGSKLMNAILEKADSMKAVCIVELLVERRKPQNIKFYEKSGFKLSTYREADENYDEKGEFTGEYGLMTREPHIGCKMNDCDGIVKFICIECNASVCCK